MSLGTLCGVGLAVWTLADSPGAPEPAPRADLVPAMALEGIGDGLEARAREADDLEGTIEAEDENSPAGDALEHEIATTTDDEKSEASEQATEGAFYVQVASYRTRSDADVHAGALSSRDLPAQAVTDGSWHKVQLGPFRGRAEAEKGRFKLTLQERREAYVMPRSNGRYHVQVASFATRAEADPVAKRFIDQGHSTKISRIKMGDQRWHCVRIGPFDTEDEARAYQALVDDVPGTESRVIPFGPPQPVAAAN